MIGVLLMVNLPLPLTPALSPLAGRGSDFPLPAFSRGEGQGEVQLRRQRAY